MKDLCEVFHPVRTKYRSFGLQIDVEQAEISCIEAEHTRLSERLCEVLIARLKKTEAFTWADIARALRSQMVGEPQLANSIMQRYCGRSDHSTYDQLGESKKYLSTSSSESDDSEFDIYLSEVEMKKLCKVFKRLFGRLCYAIKKPVEIATLLQVKGLLTRKVMSELLKSPESEQTKAITLVQALEKRIKLRPERIFTVIDVFLNYEDLQDMGRELWTEAGEWWCRMQTGLLLESGYITELCTVSTI